MRLVCVFLIFATFSAVSFSGCGGSSSNDQSINVKGVIEPVGGQPASDITLELYTHGHVDDANYLVARTVTSIWDPFEFAVSNEGTYDILLRFTLAYERWINDTPEIVFVDATRMIENIVIARPSTDLGTINVDFPVPL